MTRCKACRQPIDRNRTYYRVERGDGRPRDRDYCSLDCLADAA